MNVVYHQEDAQGSHPEGAQPSGEDILCKVVNLWNSSGLFSFHPISGIDCCELRSQVVSSVALLTRPHNCFWCGQTQGFETLLQNLGTEHLHIISVLVLL